MTPFSWAASSPSAICKKRGSASSSEEIVVNSDSPRQFMFDLVAGTAVLAADYDRAREYAERRDPQFAGDEQPEVNRFNVAGVIRFAFILQKQGENQRADALLAAALPVVRSQPRVGIAGHGIRDVQILSLQGKSFEALSALREAIDAGFRGSTFASGWPLAVDPYVESIRDKPEFRAMAREIGDAVMLMQDRVAEAEASGNWDSLRSMVDSG